MRCLILLMCCLLFSCGGASEKKAAVTAEMPPEAVLRAGKYPLWFQFGDNGVQLLETIDDAILSAALVPWPHARHIRFILASENRIIMTENGGGFICFAPWSEDNKETVAETAGGGSIGLYRFPGGEQWQKYTVGAFFMYEGTPAALLYRDNRFIDSGDPPPSPRLWTFDLVSGGPRPLSLPLLEAFAPGDGWDVDTLRAGGDGRWYFRAVNKTATRPSIKMFRHDTLEHPGPPPEGEEISSGVFQNSALPPPLSQAPAPLSEMLVEAFTKTGYAAAAVISPEFASTRHYAADRESSPLLAFYSGADPSTSRLWVIDPLGAGLYLEKNAAGITSREITLPSLPAGFVYTGLGVISGVIAAAWEEQEGYSTGAAGFMVIRDTGDGVKHENSGEKLGNRK